MSVVGDGCIEVAECGKTAGDGRDQPKGISITVRVQYSTVQCSPRLPAPVPVPVPVPVPQLPVAVFIVVVRLFFRKAHSPTIVHCGSFGIYQLLAAFLGTLVTALLSAYTAQQDQDQLRLLPTQDVFKLLLPSS